MNRAVYLRWSKFGLVVLVVMCLTLVLPVWGSAAALAADPAKTGYPNSMSAAGDSITRAFDSVYLLADAPAYSWASGTNSTVNSHYNRILAANGAISGKNFNDAKTGAVMADLNGQVTTINSRNVEYVTILLGANDACTKTEAAMTPVETFRSQFQTAMTTLSTGSPNARIFVLSIPNVYNLWSVLKGNGSARFVWALYGICQSMLAAPLSTAQADVDRRARVKQRVIDFNTVLSQVCAQYVHCRFDNNTTFNTNFLAGDVSTIDYFHPSVAGQAKLANVSYAAGFNFTDNVAPVSASAVAAVTGGKQVTLTATDNAGIAGIEYKVDTGNYQKYTAPVTVPTGSTITWRAVDINGNFEASKSLTA